MNITVSPDSVYDETRPINWCIFFEDGSLKTSYDTTWDTLSILQEIGGASVHVSVLPIKGLLLRHRDWQSCYELVPAKPIPMFAFTRVASIPAASTPGWLYSGFGYDQGTYRVFLRAHAGGVESILSDSHVPLTF